MNAEYRQNRFSLITHHSSLIISIAQRKALSNASALSIENLRVSGL
jgi:hypothetical protein